MQYDGRTFAGGLTVMFLAASVVGSRWSLEKEERLQSKVRNVDIASQRRVGMQVRLLSAAPSRWLRADDRPEWQPQASALTREDN